MAQIPNTQFAWVPHVGWQYWCYLLVGVLQGLLSVLIVKCLAIGSSIITRASLFKARPPA